jgi:hypothetical protein
MMTMTEMAAVVQVLRRVLERCRPGGPDMSYGQITGAIRCAVEATEQAGAAVETDEFWVQTRELAALYGADVRTAVDADGKVLRPVRCGLCQCDLRDLSDGAKNLDTTTI